MSSITDQIRSEADRRLQQALLEAPIVAQVVQAQEQQEGPTGLRRSLLASALRLSPAIAPQSNQILHHCQSTLGVETEVELFVSDVRAIHVRDELMATGGSVYYLSQDEVVEGSE